MSATNGQQSKTLAQAVQNTQFKTARTMYQAGNNIYSANSDGAVQQSSAAVPSGSASAAAVAAASAASSGPLPMKAVDPSALQQGGRGAFDPTVTGFIRTEHMLTTGYNQAMLPDDACMQCGLGANELVKCVPGKYTSNIKRYAECDECDAANAVRATEMYRARRQRDPSSKTTNWVKSQHKFQYDANQGPGEESRCIVCGIYRSAVYHCNPHRSTDVPPRFEVMGTQYQSAQCDE